jgi:hypothetical protein
VNPSPGEGPRHATRRTERLRIGSDTADRASSSPISSASFLFCVLPVAMEAIRPSLGALRRSATRRAPRPLCQCLHTSPWRCAQPLPQPSVPGPPPEPPTPAASDPLDRVARKRKQAELLKQAREVRSSPSRPKTLLQKRFWQHVYVQETDGNFSN